MITVFYDGKCSLCRKEITYYKRIAPPEKFIWLDLSEDSNLLTQRNVSLRTGLMFFHAEDKDGKMHTSLDAFILVWKQLRGWQYVAIIVSLPIVKPLMNLIYKLFAKYRFKKNGYCKIKFK
ncbi:MAG: DUF393 domain-containing protein [Legionellaceae bacterium]|nr:DUF393 domain-containing protein [Legionellaceae bacterium]